VRHRVQRAAFQADGTCLTLADGRALQFPARPDPSGTVRVHAALRRITRVDVAIDGDLVSTQVHGIGHRREATVPVSLETALALALEGSPCCVQLPDGFLGGAQPPDEVLPA
jgi:hypothetical protein